MSAQKLLLCLICGKRYDTGQDSCPVCSMPLMEEKSSDEILLESRARSLERSAKSKITLHPVLSTFSVFFGNASSQTKEKPRPLPHPKKINRAHISIIITFAVITVAGLAAWNIWRGESQHFGQMSLWAYNLKTGETVSLHQTGLGASFSPQGDRFVFSSPNSRNTQAAIKIYSLKNRKVDPLIEDGNLNTEVFWGRDGDLILYASVRNGQKDLWIYSIADRTFRQLTADAAKEEGASLSPDGKWIAFVQPDDKGIKDIYFLPSEGGVKTRLTHSEQFLSTTKFPTWSPDSKKIAYFSLTSLYLIDLESHQMESIDLADSGVACQFQWLSFNPKNEEELIFKDRASEALRYNLYSLHRQSKQVGIFKPSSPSETGQSLSPDGQWLVYSQLT